MIIKYEYFTFTQTLHAILLCHVPSKRFLVALFVNIHLFGPANLTSAWCMCRTRFVFPLQFPFTCPNYWPFLGTPLVSRIRFWLAVVHKPWHKRLAMDQCLLSHSAWVVCLCPHYTVMSFLYPWVVTSNYYILSGGTRRSFFYSKSEQNMYKIWALLYNL